MRTVVAKKGERTCILRIISDSIPQRARFGARPVDGDGPVSGTVEVERWTLIGSKPSETYALQPENRVQKGFWDTRFKIFVTPDQDTEIVFRTRHFSAGWLFLVLALVLLLGVAGGLWAYFSAGA